MRRHVFLASVMAFAAGMLVLGCGGGGGGSSSESVNYQGQTMPAVIDTTSAVQLAVDATVGTRDSESYGGGVSPLGFSAAGEPGAAGGIGYVEDPGLVLGLVRDHMNPGGSVQFLDASAEPLAVECQTLHMDTGSAGGTMSLKICADPEKYFSSTRYWISAAVIFDEYDNSVGSTTDYQDGQIVVQGTFDETLGTEGDFDGPATLIFRDLVTVDVPGGEDSYIDGWAVYEEGTGTVTVTYNLAILDNVSDKACWMDGYVMHIDHLNDEVTLSGRFYDSEAGYVDLTTESVLSWDIDMDAAGELVWNSDHPTAGTVKLTGAGGYWISITFTAAGYSVQVNYTGDEAGDITLPGVGEYPWN